MRWWEDASQALLPLGEAIDARLDRVVAAVNTATDSLADTLHGVPDRVRYAATHSANTAEDSVAAIRRRLPEGIVDPFVPEAQDTTRFFNQLPKFGNQPLITDAEITRLTTPANMVARSHGEAVEAVMARMDASFARAQMLSRPKSLFPITTAATEAGWETEWQAIQQRARLKTRLGDIQKGERGWARVSSELEPLHEAVEMTEMGVIAEDAAVLDAQRLVLEDPAVQRSIAQLTDEIDGVYLAMQDMTQDGMGMTSDGMFVQTAEVGDASRRWYRMMQMDEGAEMMASGRRTFVELTEVKTAWEVTGDGPLAAAFEDVYTGDIEDVLSMHNWTGDGLEASSRRLVSAANMDEFDALLPDGLPLDELPLGAVDAPVIDRKSVV